jgi:hypothetical protein
VKAAVSSSSGRDSPGDAEKQVSVDKGVVKYYENTISRMKNFVETTHRCVPVGLQGCVGCNLGCKLHSYFE